MAKGQMAFALMLDTKRPFSNPFLYSSTRNSGRTPGSSSPPDVRRTRKPIRSPLPKPGSGSACPVGTCTVPYPMGYTGEMRSVWPFRTGFDHEVSPWHCLRI